MDSLVEKLRKLSPGIKIPKPVAKGDFTIKGWGKRGGKASLIYYIPNKSDSDNPHQKGITVDEWEQAYQQLVTSGQFTKKWFGANMSRCSKEGSCNFTTIGGIFSLWREATYDRPGVYLKIKS